MEDEDEKMMALKKAYAEIILNTAKESAARIMASERKAVLFEQDLSSTKDDALRILLRLKQMIDSKTNEAEMTSLSQRRKIEDLEEQLDETEGMITDLRTELNQVRNKLHKAKSNRIQTVDRVVENYLSSDEITTPEDKQVAFQPIVSSTVGSVEGNRSSSTMVGTEQFSGSHPENKSDLASIIMRSKEPELYRNGCTQRIRAFERNLLDGKFPSSVDVVYQHFSKKDESIPETSGTDEGKYTVHSQKTNNMEIEMNLPEEWEKTDKTRMLGRRKTHYGKATTTSSRFRPGQPSSVLPHWKSYSVNGCYKSDEREGTKSSSPKANNRNLMRKSNRLKEKLQQNRCCDKDEAVNITSKGKRKRKVKCRNAVPTSFRSLDELVEPSRISSCLSRCKTYTYSVSGNVNFDEDRSKIVKNEVQMKPLLRLDPGLTLIRSGMDPISGSKNVTISIKTLDKYENVQSVVDKDKELMDDDVLVKHEDEGNVAEDTASIDTLDIPISDLEVMKASEVTEAPPSQADNNNCLKYTFTRKRKKESLSYPNEKNSPEKRAVKRIREEDNGMPEPQKSCAIDKSSRDCRRLAQVARQLISLSGKRW